MQLYQMPPSEPFCLLYSSAMVLGIEPEALKKMIGHDGTEEIWPFMNYKYRNFHIEEIQRACMSRGKVLVFVDPFPTIKPPRNCEQIEYTVWPLAFAWTRFCNLMGSGRGLLISSTHAMAVENGNVYDPRGIDQYPVWKIDKTDDLQRTREDIQMGYILLDVHY